MKLLRSKWGIGAIAATLLILFLYRPGVYRLRTRIASSISSAIGRRVSIDNVNLRILPRPGFDIEGLVIYDAPAFSAEPMIRAQEVTAAIRLRSLLRGRLEIATLSATEPSINIVRNGEGRWNLARLIERAAQIPAAPTAKSASERRPAFPYLEATGARINFKIGLEKKPYALTDADVALWQDSENSWGARMKAHPVRTDFNLTDTGLLQVNAAWQRAPSLRQTPARITAAWTNGQLGQITELLTARDSGWRGGADVTANISGTPEGLAIESAALITGFRRYDIVDTRNLRLATGCTGTYNALTRSLSGLLCESRAGGGVVRVHGRIDTVSPPTYDLTTTVDKVSLTSLLSVLREAKQQLPPDLNAEGMLNAEFRAVRNGPRPAQLTGTGTAAEVRLIANGERDSISLGNIPLTLVPNPNCCQPVHSAVKQNRNKTSETLAEAYLRIGPVSMRINDSAPLTTEGWVATDSYRFSLRGDTELKDLFRLENTLGIPSARPAAEGSAKLDVSLTGSWLGFAVPTALGTVQLRNVRAEMNGLNTPIEISSATLELATDSFTMQKISAQTGGTHWSGSVSAPRHCTPACDFQFDLTADRLSTAHLGEWFTPQLAKRPWYRILSSEEQRNPSPLLALHGSGKLRVGEFEFKKLAATQLTTRVTLNRGKVMLASLQAQLLHGTHQGDWTINALAHPVQYHGSGALQNIALAQVGALMNDAWISGSADGSFDLDTSGISFPELLSNANGKLHFAMHNGNLTRIGFSDAPRSLPVYRFEGDLHVNKGAWDMAGGKLESHDGLYRVDGTAAAASGLDFKFTRGDQQYWKVTGTLAKPRVTPVNHPEPSSAGSAPKATKP